MILDVCVVVYLFSILLNTTVQSENLRRHSFILDKSIEDIAFFLMLPHKSG